MTRDCSKNGDKHLSLHSAVGRLGRVLAKLSPLRPWEAAVTPAILAKLVAPMARQVFLERHYETPCTLLLESQADSRNLDKNLNEATCPCSEGVLPPSRPEHLAHFHLAPALFRPGVTCLNR